MSELPPSDPSAQPKKPAPGFRPPGLDLAEARATFKRINGYLHRVVPVLDTAGKVVNFAVQPVMVEFRPRDVAQVVVGAVILGVPVLLSDEATSAARDLPWPNIIGIALLSVGFIAGFVYLNFYRNQFRGNATQFVKRVVSTYLITLVVVAGMMELLQLSPWGEDPVLAVRRMVLVGLPASLFATIADTVK
ncbi:MAG: DUF2391 family protein [Planctomycetota bacterium]